MKKKSSRIIKVISTLKRETKNPNLGRLIKIKKAEKKLRDPLKQDQADFEDKIFRVRRFSDLQKYLRSVFKCNKYPETMSYKDNKTNEDSQKCKYFNDFFSSIFLKSNTVKMKKSYEKQKFIKVNIDERKIKEILTKLQTNKACGPDNVANTILKNLPTLSKSLHIVFQAALNKSILENK